MKDLPDVKPVAGPYSGNSASRREKPILFSGEMVKAILEGRKTQTRRVLKPQPFLERGKEGNWWFLDRSKDGYGLTNSAWKEGAEPYWTYCPYGRPGWRLWVRETFNHYGNQYSDGRSFALISYAADLSHREIELESPPTRKCWEDHNATAQPSIFMPRWASRVTLEIVSVTVERIQDISMADAKAEGRECIAHLHSTWDELNKKRGFGWDANPWVWVIEFKKITSPSANPSSSETLLRDDQD